jgi:hypothetical protein
MPRNITVTFDDGTTHVYQNAPDDLTPQAVYDRAAQEFTGKKIVNLDGGKKAAGVRGSIPIADGVVNAVPETPIVKPRDYSFGDVTAEITAPSRQMMSEGISSLYAPEAAPGTMARVGEGLAGAGKIALGGLGTLTSGFVGSGVELASALTGAMGSDIATQGGKFEPVTGRRKLAQELNEMLMFVEPNPVTGPRTMARGATKGTPQRVVKPALEERPSSVIKTEAQELFRAPEIKDLKFKPAAGDKLIDDVTSVIEKDALFSPVQHTKVIRSMRDIEKTIGQPLTYERLQGLSSRLGAAANETKDATQATILQNMKRSVDDFMGSAPDTLIETGNLPKAKETLSAAKDTWRRKLKSEVIEPILNDIRLESADKDISAVAKAKFKTLAKNEDELKRFSPEERALIEDLAAGGPMSQQIFQGAGKLAPAASRGLLLGLYGILLGSGFSAPVAAIGGAAMAGRKLANKMATAQVNRLYDSVLRGEVLPKKMPVTKTERLSETTNRAQVLRAGAVADQENRNRMSR